MCWARSGSLAFLALFVKSNEGNKRGLDIFLGLLAQFSLKPLRAVEYGELAYLVFASVFVILWSLVELVLLQFGRAKMIIRNPVCFVKAI